MKRVIIRFPWILYTIIWYLYAFIFGDCKIFPTTGGFSGAVKRRNDEVFRNIFKMVNLDEIFYVMKVFGKIHLGISFIVHKNYVHGIERLICECKLEYQSSSGYNRHKSKYHSGKEVVYPPGWYFARTSH